MRDSEGDIQVSVCVVTYNQEKYIAECLESLVNQQTKFKFEIIVGEDCSTDNTRLIVQEYVNKYPNLIVPLFYNKNVGAVENIKQVYKKAKGKYIAHVDGDDVALQNKLQAQFEVLESSLSCNVCSHNMQKISKDGDVKKRGWYYLEGEYELIDLYRNLPFFAHSSKMFRNKYKPAFWDNLLSNPIILDIDVHVANLEDGNIYHLNETLGRYRVDSGVSTKDFKYNNDLPLGVERVFERGLIIYKDDIINSEKLRKYYSVAMLQCAYNYAIYDKDSLKFKIYVDKSVSQADIGRNQKIFKIASKYPKLFFNIFYIRNKIRSI